MVGGEETRGGGSLLNPFFSVVGGGEAMAVVRLGVLVLVVLLFTTVPVDSKNILRSVLTDFDGLVFFLFSFVWILSPIETGSGKKQKTKK